MGNPASRSTRLSEFVGLSCFALALMLLISLATYNPHDPAFYFKAGMPDQARNFIGPVGAFLAELLIPQLFGAAAILLPLMLAVTGWKLFWCKPIDAPYTKLVGLALLLGALTAFLSLSFDSVAYEGETVRAGGACGEQLAALLVQSFNRTGAYIVVATTLFVSIILCTQFSFARCLSTIGGFVALRVRALHTAWAHHSEARRKEQMRREVIRKHTQKEQGEAQHELSSDDDELDPQGSVANGDELADFDLLAPPPRRAAAPVQKPLPFGAAPEVLPAFEEQRQAEPELESPRPARPATAKRRGLGAPAPPAPPAPSRSTRLPPTSILDPHENGTKLDNARLFERGRLLQTKCVEFGVLGKVIDTHPGPVVTTYEFKPDAGIKYSKIVALADDLALALEAESVRIDRMSGRSTVGIEIPNEKRETIYLRQILESEPFAGAVGLLTLALGKTVEGDPCVTNLAQMPHLLIAGSTGTGKSVGLNCMIASLLFKATAEEVRLVLIDPKRLELGVYEDIPHLLTPVVTDAKIAANVLKWAVGEMEKRIRKLASAGVRNIDQFNHIIRAEKQTVAPGEEPLRPLHYIVVVIDELADLMMVSSHEVEESITRLAQMARAVGIHLILATQRPSVDVITGLIKANFPSRISFRVAARVDSRTILDSIGAERLLGRGDMLFLPPGSARLSRIHGALVSEQEIARLTSWLRESGKPVFDDTVGKTERSAEAAASEDRDELFDEAVRFVVQAKQASTSMLQRRFRIGFSRAGRLVDLMERDGIVGPAEGSKPREILVPADYYATVDAWPK